MLLDILETIGTLVAVGMFLAFMLLMSALGTGVL